MRIAMKVLCTGALLLSGTTVAHLDASGSASSIQACVSPNGAVRILLTQESCKANETTVALAAPVEPPPPPGEGGGLHVVNALGANIGPLIGPSTAVLTLPNGTRVYAELFPANAPADWLVPVYYTSSDCSGEGFVSWGYTEELVTPALVRRVGVWALRPGTLAPRAVGSYHLVGDSGPGACQTFATTLDGWAFDFYHPTELGIVYPLSVE